MALAAAVSDAHVVTRPLPVPRGPLSAIVVNALVQGPSSVPLPLEDVDRADPYGEDLALALYTCYELHYRGFEGVDSLWEWEPELLRLRAAMERVFLAALRCDINGCDINDDVTAALDALLIEPVPGNGVSHYLKDVAPWWQMREYIVHRSVYHLKEADPHAWVIPRLQGQAKASLVAVEFDEFGGGRGERVHAQLYADLMAAAGLSAAYLHYLDDVPAPAMAIVNMMSMFGLHRRLRGAMVGHFAAAEVTTPPSAHRITQAMERLGAPPACRLFFTEHIEADAVHEQVLRRDVIGDLLRREPHLAADVVFGIAATELLEARLAGHLLDAWRSGATSLRRPLPEHSV
ncbi:MAG: iron-containing redox enzyme family protein [Actinomycetota bacterium]|nr:iron-containing redox enzyme family protein [Actinomycetota bacterium]